MFDVHLLDLVPWVGGEVGHVRQLIGWAVTANHAVAFQPPLRTRDMPTQRVCLRQKLCISLGFLEQIGFLFNSRKCHFYDFFNENPSLTHHHIHQHFSCPLLGLLAVSEGTYTTISLYICHIYLLLYILMLSFPPLGSLGCLGLKNGNGCMIMLMHFNAVKIFCFVACTHAVPPLLFFLWI